MNWEQVERQWDHVKAQAHAKVEEKMRFRTPGPFFPLPSSST